MGRPAIALFLLFVLTVGACTPRADPPQSRAEVAARAEVPATWSGPIANTTTAGLGANDGAAGKAQTTAQSTSVADVSVAGTSVSVVSNVSGSSSVSISSSATSSGSSSVVNVSITTAAGSFNRTVRIDRAGRFLLRVTADGDGVPVIQVEEVGP